MLEYLKVDLGGEDGKVVCLQSGQLIAGNIMGSASWFHEKIGIYNYLSYCGNLGWAMVG
jgi:hypothetical protein